jgi:hypothetical protein
VDVPVTEVFMVAGFHIPVTPLSDTVDKAGAAAFWHNAPIGLNVGVVLKLTAIVSVAVVAHCPVAGVKV